ncbi:MAG: ATP-dependent RecD-like DNA helicase [Desulfobacteraceae bacterium]|jgi:exodeoxyribonuclease V alpha subunit|nr:ATP-dependent RecD-like DNA helicase [Desulfobacteraceae bacterium]
MKNKKSTYPHVTTIEGRLERITYFNENTHYTIARLKPAGLSATVTVVGYLAGVSLGEALKVNGRWETHPKYGQQLKIDSFEVTLPAGIEGIRTYLGSGIVKGIGPSLAARMVNAFGAETLEIIQGQPERLVEVDGIGETKAALIQNAWSEHHALRGLMQFLQKMGVQTSYCAKIYKEYGPDAVSLIQEDPFVLADDFPGAGFLMADAIARKQGVETEDPERVRACILHLILQNADDGHTFAERENLSARCENQFQIGQLAFENAIDELIEAKVVMVEPIADDPWASSVYLKELYHAESGLAKRLQAMLSVPVGTSEIEADSIAKQVHQKLAINLSNEQLQVLEQIFSHRLAIITGGPGTGKTTLLRSISTIFQTEGKRLLLAAPTGRAARRLAEVTRRKASTIHRLLGYSFTDNGFLHNRDNPLDTDAVIIDEASMVDTVLMNNLLAAVPLSARLVLVGDVFQLPSVGPGNVLSDMIDSGSIPVFYLSKIFRQDRESAIVVNAHQVREGKLTDFPDSTVIDELSDFYFLEQSDPDLTAARIVELCCDELPAKFGLDPVNDIQVLTPMHKGAVGTINLNNLLQKVLNRQHAAEKTPGISFKPGDKVMHLKNNYQKEVYNGDIGIVDRIDDENAELTVNYYGKAVSYEFDELDEMTMAYAISIHKSQGSEYPAVIVPLMTQHYVMLQRNLLYTAMTRGKELVILIGTRKALKIALQNDKPHRRLSSLAARLKSNI